MALPKKKKKKNNIARLTVVKCVESDILELDKNNVLAAWLPQLLTDIEDCGGKSQTDYMDKNMCIGERPTPLGKARQIMAEINVIQETFKCLKKEGTREEILEARIYIRGAVKRTIVLTEMYKDICTLIQVPEITNEMIEAGQHEEQIKTMLQQAVGAAVSNGGVATEGDFIYSIQVGMTANEVQIEILAHVFNEDGTLRDIDMIEQHQWLDATYNKYKNRLAKLNKYLEKFYGEKSRGRRPKSTRKKRSRRISGEVSVQEPAA